MHHRPPPEPLSRKMLGSDMRRIVLTNKLSSSVLTSQSEHLSEDYSTLSKRRPITGRRAARHCGHVFILHCHPKGLAADTVLLPAKDPVNPTEHEVQQLSADRPTAAEEGEHPTPTSIVFEGRIGTTSYQDESTAFVGICKVVKHYVERAGALLEGTESTFGRALPLLALPLPVGLVALARVEQDVGRRLPRCSPSRRTLPAHLTALAVGLD